jgi:hypothetical protein
MATLKPTPIWDRQCKSFRTLVKGEGEGEGSPGKKSERQNRATD